MASTDAKALLNDTLDKQLLDCSSKQGCVDDAVSAAKELGTSSYMAVQFLKLAGGIKRFQVAGQNLSLMPKQMFDEQAELTLKVEAAAYKIVLISAKMGLLVGKGASIDRTCAIHYVVANCQDSIMTPRTGEALEGIVKLLTHLGGDINRPDSTGDTPLHVAAAMQSLSTIRLMLGLGADASLAVKNAQGRTPLQIFKRQGKRMAGYGLPGINEDERSTIIELLKPPRKRKATAQHGGDVSRAKK